MAHIRIDNETLFIFTDPDPALIHVEDIAKVLSRISRFNSHGVKGRRISVAEHSVNVVQMVRRRCLLETSMGRERQSILFGGLLHDGHEYIVGDISTPVKTVIGRPLLETITDPVDAAIGQAVGFDHTYMKHLFVKTADKEILAHESHWIFRGHSEDDAEEFLTKQAKKRVYTHKKSWRNWNPKIGLDENEAYDAFMTEYERICEEF